MEVFVARQPIINQKEEIYGYELLYRSSHKKNHFVPMDENLATSEVLRNSFFTIGLERLSEHKPCFINFTEDLLLEKVPEYFQPEHLVVEILEDVTFSRDLIRVCRELKEKKFLIALDDVVQINETAWMEVLQYIDILKVDIQSVTNENRLEIVEIAKRMGVTLLAEKVETREEHERCVREGFHLFQGYYFSKPVIVTGVEIPFFHSTYYQIIQELSQPSEEIDIERVGEILGQDLSLTYRLLRLINTTLNRGSVPVQSIKQAVMLMGTDSLEKWLYVLSIEKTAPANEKTSHLVAKTSLLRAKMCEQLAIRMRAPGSADTYFLTGFISLIDVITKRPMEEMVRLLPLKNDIKQALTGDSSTCGEILKLSIALEKADFEFLDEQLDTYDLTFNEVFEIYGQAIAWADQLYHDHFSRRA